jgi:hypothetical protein
MQIGSNEIVNQLIASNKTEAETSQKIAYAIAGKQLDAQKQAGEAIVQLIQQSATNASSDGLDVRA